MTQIEAHAFMTYLSHEMRYNELGEPVMNVLDLIALTCISMYTLALCGYFIQIHILAT